MLSYILCTRKIIFLCLERIEKTNDLNLEYSKLMLVNRKIINVRYVFLNKIIKQYNFLTFLLTG